MTSMRDDRADHTIGADGLIWWCLARLRSSIAVGVTAGIVWMASLAALPVTVGRAVDAAIDDTASGGWTRTVPALTLLTAVALVGALAGAVRHRMAVTLWIRTRLLVEGRLTDRLLDRRGGVDRPTGELLSLGVGDATKIGLVADITNRGAGAVVTVIVVAVWLLSTSVSLGLIVLAVVPLTIGLFAPFLGSYDRRATAERQQLARASAAASDGITGLRIAQGVGAGPQITRWFTERSAAMHRAALSVVRLEAALFGTVGSLPMLSVVPVIWFGGTQTIEGRISAGVLVGVVGLTQFLATPIFTLGEAARTITGGRASARRVATVLSEPTTLDGEAPADPEDAGVPEADEGQVGAGAERPLLELRRLSSGGLRNVSLTVAPGETVGVACGRDEDAATLAALLARHRRCPTGSVLVEGHPLGSIPLTSLHHRLSVVDTERPWLLAASLAANLRLARAEATDDELVAALERAGADELLGGADPLGRVLGERGLQLSGGQRQRVAVAQAVLSPAAVVVVVEPTSALDAVTEATVVRRFVVDDPGAGPETGGGRLLLTTSAAVLNACDRVIHLDDGLVRAAGTHHELLASDAEYGHLTGVGR
ncbi:MAG: ABC transporter ATP-binding protein [Actinomycetota bacterium]